MKMTIRTLFGDEEIEGKVCISCNEFKTYDMYTPRTRNKEGQPVELRNDCKSCMSSKRKTVSNLKKYNKIPDDHTCPICERKSKDFMHRYGGSPFCLDHDHESLQFRGFVCQDCNVGLARFNEDPFTMARAIKYINEWNERKEKSSEEET